MNRFFLAIVLSVFLCTSLFAQIKSESLLIVGDEEISKEEFIRVYTKNNQNAKFDSVSLTEYIQLFIDFKLKVIEAKSLGYDTIVTFKKELAGYVKQLEKPYFTDKKADEDLLVEAYERMKWNIRASHILIMCDENTLPKDTLIAYNKIREIKKRINKGEDFGKLAKQLSEDPSAVNNSGDLGCFSAFAMVYPFEKGAYDTSVGKVSSIIRTRFGYHLIKVVDKKSNKGQVKVAHIMFAVPRNANKTQFFDKEKLANVVYDSIVSGANFSEMALRYSDDGGTNQKGGELPFFGRGRMIPEFEKTAFSLENINDISAPIKTTYGFHIIKLLEKKPLASYEELKSTIKNKVSRDVRAQRGKDMVVKRLAHDYKAKVYHENLKSIVSLMNPSIYEGNWAVKKGASLNKKLYVLVDSIVYTQQDFVNYLSLDGKKKRKIPFELLIEKEFKEWCSYKLFDLERTNLPEKYPEYKYLAKEYHDGILLFNLMEDKVWSKAVEDTVGLESFYQKVKADYMWEPRVEASIYNFNHEKWKKKLTKLAKKTANKNLDIDEQINIFKQKAVVEDSLLSVSATKEIYAKKDNALVDSLGWKLGLKPIVKNSNHYTLIYVNRKVASEPKELSEIKGLIIAEYQNYLEKEWINNLRDKYKVTINQKVLNSLFK